MNGLFCLLTLYDSYLLRLHLTDYTLDRKYRLWRANFHYNLTHALIVANEIIAGYRNQLSFAELAGVVYQTNTLVNCHRRT